MAKLTKKAVEKRKEDEAVKIAAIMKKYEIQKKKELYGEKWKTVEQQNLKSEIEDFVGSDNAPKIQDFQDLYEYFDVVKFYRDRQNNALKMDYEQYLDSEDQYRDAIKRLDEAIQQKKTDLKQKTWLNEDGEDESNKVEPKVLDEKGNVVETVAEENPDEEKAEEADGTEDTNETKKPQSKYIEQALQKAKLNQAVSRFFNRFVPIYDKQVCTCCGKPRSLTEYYVVYNIICCDRVDENGSYHMYICKDCCQKLFGYLYTQVANKNVELAMQYVCAYLNLYWDVEIFYTAKDKFDVSGRKGTLLGAYIREINNNACNKTFMDSPFLSQEQYNSANRVVNISKNETPYDWEKEDARNKATVIKMVGYDPFEYYKDEDKKILYRDLLNILDEGMQNDLVKFQAGIQIVQSFFKIRQLNKKEFDMQQRNAALSDLKSLSDLKAKELAAISKFSSDNGFSERYATAKAKGENTFTGILNKMNEKKFEDALLNRYDIETSETIQQAADASIKAIMGQLSLGESEVWKTCQQQLEELIKVRKENAKLAEELRKAKLKIAEIRLKEKAKEYNESLGIEEGEEYD